MKIIAVENEVLKTETKDSIVHANTDTPAISVKNYCSSDIEINIEDRQIKLSDYEWKMLVLYFELYPRDLDALGIKIYQEIKNNGKNRYGDNDIPWT